MTDFIKLPLEENETRLTEILDAYQKEHTGLSQQKQQTFSMGAYSDGNYIGGIIANTWMNNTHVSLLAVDRHHRKAGLGSRLLKHAEAFARQQQSEIVTLNTLDFQAKDFYEKHGYQVFGTLADCPLKGITKYYLVKRL